MYAAHYDPSISHEGDPICFVRGVIINYNNLTFYMINF
jgi:hypothetical protein